MNIISNLLSERVVEALGWTFVHSIWQGALIALVLGIIMIATHKFTSTTRYFIAAAALLFMLSCSVFTFVRSYNHTLPIITEQSSYRPAGSDEAFIKNGSPETNSKNNPENAGYSNFFQNYRGYFYRHFPLIVTLWILGMLVFALKFMGSIAYIQRMKNYRIMPVDREWEKKFHKLRRELGLSKSIKIYQSALAKVPLVIGYIKPVILLPVSAFSGLTPQQLESIIVHELAHIVRHDYLVNLLQSMVEILFFYHPAVWWISSVIRSERENCCDDLAIKFTGDAINFAKALAGIQEQLIRNEELAMAVTGKKNKLLKRIQRLTNNPNTKTNFAEGFIASCIVFAGILALMINVKANPSPPVNFQSPDMGQQFVKTSLVPPSGIINLTARDTVLKTTQSDEENNNMSESDRELEILKKEAEEARKDQKAAQTEQEKSKSEASNAMEEQSKALEDQKKALEEQKAVMREQERAKNESIEKQKQAQIESDNLDELSDEISRGIEEGLKNMDINKIVNEAVKGAQAGLKEIDFNRIVKEAMKNAHDEMDDIDVDRTVNETVRGARAALNEMDINAIVNEAMKGVSAGMKEIDIDKAVKNNTGVSRAPSPTNQVNFRGDETHLEIIRKGSGEWNKWRKENPSVKPDLQGAFLSDINLKGADLSNVNFSGADLKEANLQNADLRNANLQGTNLKEALLKGAKLTGADFTGADLKETDLSGFDLKDIVFNKANMKEIKLNHADMKGVSLRGTNLKEAELNNADLKRADMRGTDFSQSHYQNADFKGAFYDTTTLFPPDFDPVKEGMKLK